MQLNKKSKKFKSLNDKFSYLCSTCNGWPDDYPKYFLFYFTLAHQISQFTNWDKTDCMFKLAMGFNLII